MDLELIGIGMAIGIAVTMPLGPVNLTVIRAALRAGMGGGIGCGVGLDAWATALCTHCRLWRALDRGSGCIRYETPLQIVGGLFLIVLGIRTAIIM